MADNGKLEMHVYSTGRWAECAVDKCFDRHALIVHRGGLGHRPLFLCEDCIADIAEEYVKLVGKDKARQVLAATMALLADDPETVTERDAGTVTEDKSTTAKPRKRTKDEA